jgi:cytochrome c oxidase subunit IV
MAVQSATSGQAPAGAMAPEHPEPNYIAVFIYLAILTGAELGVYAAGFPKPVMIGLLVALALAKAVLVAMYFMHLAMERKGLWVIAATPLVIVAFCYLMLRPDLSARSWAHTPENQVIGHHEGAAEAAPSSEGQPAAAEPAQAAPASGEAPPQAPASSGDAQAPAAPQP